MHILSIDNPTSFSFSIDQIELLKAYIETSYELYINGNTVPISLRVGQPYPKNLTQDWIGQGLAVITAWNPASQFMSLQENRERQKSLKADLMAGPGQVFDAIGRSITGPWAEESLAVTNISLEDAIQVGATYGQNAILWVTSEKTPVVALCKPFWDSAKFDASVYLTSG